MARRSGQREQLRRVSERRRTGADPEPASERHPARTTLVAAVLTGVSAVVVSLITGLGSSLQGFVTDTVFGDDKSVSVASDPRASNPLEVEVVPEESSMWLVSAHRATGSDRTALTTTLDTGPWNRLLRSIDAVHLTGTSYKLTITNASASSVRVVDVVPVVTKRTDALKATLIEPLGGIGSDTIPAELDLDKRYPKFTQDGKPYFSRQSQVLKAGDGFVMDVESKLLGEEYVEYHLRVDYLDSKGAKHSLTVNDPGSVPSVFRVSGAVDDTEYADYWGPDKTGRAWRLYSVAERK